MITIKDVAKLADVSVATVSRVINGSPKVSKHALDAVLSAMEVLGYTPNANAQALVNQSSDIIGVLVSDVSDPFFGALVKGIASVATKNQLNLLVCNGFHQAEQERKSIKLLISKRCKALVVHSKALSDEELIDFAKYLPGFVVINRNIPELAGHCIALNNHQGSKMATQHLIKLGHKRIAFVNSDHSIEDARDRLMGWQQALSEAGLSFDLVESANPNEDGGEQAIRNLLSRAANFTAVVAYNDAMAAGVISALLDNGFNVPEDVSVIGFDDIVFASYLRPKLTTMRYPIDLMSVEAATLALDFAQDIYQVVDNHIYLPTLVSRQSVTKAKGIEV